MLAKLQRHWEISSNSEYFFALAKIILYGVAMSNSAILILHPNIN